MANVFEVAEWFLAHEPMTHKKLQKLCYYFKAWGLALCGKDFIPESTFEAWVHGPVCPELYDKYREYSDWWVPIPQVETLNDSVFTDEQKDVLDTVWQTYGDWSANALEVQTHRDQPWRNARMGYGELERCKEPIKNKDMMEFYRAVYRASQGD